MRTLAGETEIARFFTYEPKYPKATACLLKDRDALLAFYDFRPSTGSTANE